MSSRPPIPRAPNVREKLDVAEQALSALEGQIAQCALDEAEGAPGAAAKMAALTAKISAARSERHKLRQALRLASDIDRRNQVEARSKIRTSQLTAFQGYAREREAAVVEMCDAAKTLAKACQRYGASTRKMLGVVPLDSHLPKMSLGPNGVLGSALGSLEQLLAVELYRCAAPDADGQRFLAPFAKAMTLNTDDVSKMPAGVDVFREAQAALSAEIKAQLEQIEAKELAAIGDPLKEAV
jgi:hypothetical protein